MPGLQVIGAGFGRTGTLSLRQALDDQGLGRTYHGEDILFRPTHIRAWQKASHGEKVDWDRLFRKFGSAVDYPVCNMWRELAEHFPESKIVLTVRDPEGWYRSTRDTIYAARTMLPGYMRRFIPTTRWYVDLTDSFLWNGIFEGRFEERDFAIKVFEQHIEDVKATADPDRLLVYNVAEGWEPLCAFLGVPVPDHPFPRLNDTARMKRTIVSTKVGSRVIPPVAAGAAALALGRRLMS
jgi:hypothetical protein